jgi:hypothetical protein
MRLIAVGLALLVLSSAADARPRSARCVISTEDAPYRGPCRFSPGAGGSFALDPVRGRRFFGDITGITVDMIGRREAEVRGLTTAGINSRWGPARRSRRDPACWDGEDFRICVY